MLAQPKGKSNIFPGTPETRKHSAKKWVTEVMKLRSVGESPADGHGESRNGAPHAAQV
jgi:hypothetical protein